MFTEYTIIYYTVYITDIVSSLALHCLMWKYVVLTLFDRYIYIMKNTISFRQFEPVVGITVHAV